LRSLSSGDLTVKGMVIDGLPSSCRGARPITTDHCGNRTLSPWLAEGLVSTLHLHVRLLSGKNESSEPRSHGICDFPSLLPDWWAEAWILQSPPLVQNSVLCLLTQLSHAFGGTRRLGNLMLLGTN
jgi:hypothetical protein